MLRARQYPVPQYPWWYPRYRGTGSGRYRGTRPPGWAGYRVPQPATGEAIRAPLMVKRQTVVASVTLALASVAHGLVGLFIFFSGLVAHPGLWLTGLVAWIFGAYLIARWRRRPGRVPFVPITLAAAYFLGLVIGERLGLVGA